MSMTSTALAGVFAEHRGRLRAIASRILGSTWDGEDAVQETWLRLQRTDADGIENLGAWLTTVVSRVSVDLLRNRGARHEDPEAVLPEQDDADDVLVPESSAERTEELEAALAVVLETLTPLERLAFVLHDLFALSFDDIAPIVERTPTAARQLASRARRRVRGVDVSVERARRADAVDAFLRASREGDFGALLQLLDPEVELRADPQAVAIAEPNAAVGAPLLRERVRGADAVARVFAGRADAAEIALVDGLPGAVYAPGARPRAVYVIRLREGRIVGIDAVSHEVDRFAVALSR